MISPERGNKVAIIAGVWEENRSEEIHTPVKREQPIA